MLLKSLHLYFYFSKLLLYLQLIPEVLPRFCLYHLAISIYIYINIYIYIYMYITIHYILYIYIYIYICICIWIDTWLVCWINVKYSIHRDAILSFMSFDNHQVSIIFLKWTNKLVTRLTKLVKQKDSTLSLPILLAVCFRVYIY